MLRFGESEFVHQFVVENDHRVKAIPNGYALKANHGEHEPPGFGAGFDFCRDIVQFVVYLIVIVSDGGRGVVADWKDIAE